MYFSPIKASWFLSWCQGFQGPDWLISGNTVWIKTKALFLKVEGFVLWWWGGTDLQALPEAMLLSRAFQGPGVRLEAKGVYGDWRWRWWCCDTRMVAFVSCLSRTTKVSIAGGVTWYLHIKVQTYISREYIKNPDMGLKVLRTALKQWDFYFKTFHVLFP